MTASNAVANTIPVSVVIITYNEEASIEACLRSVSSFQDVIVVDSNSTDATRRLAEDMGAKVVNFTWTGRFPKKKQWSITNSGATNDWILLLDADEAPTPALIAEIEQICKDGSISSYAAYDISLRYVFGGHTLRHGHVVTKRALVNRTRCSFDDIDDVELPGSFEVEGHYQPTADGPVRRLQSRLLHDDRDSVSTWFDRHNKYSDWEAALRHRRELRDAVDSRRSRRGQVFAAVPFKPMLFFLYSYVAMGGFLDGRPGFHYAIANSFYYWQIGLKSYQLRSQPLASFGDSSGVSGDADGQATVE